MEHFDCHSHSHAVSCSIELINSDKVIGATNEDGNILKDVTRPMGSAGVIVARQSTA